MATKKDEVIEETQEQDEQTPDLTGAFHFYKSRIAGLEIYLNADVVEASQIEKVNFRLVKMKNLLDEVVKLGVLKTDNDRVIEILASDPNVVEITEKEYNEIVK